MSSTDNLQDRLKRLLWGFIGATLAVGPPLASWVDTKYSGQSNVPMVEYMTAFILFISWLAAMYLAWMEREPHVWNVFFKSVGVPGTLVAVGHVFQL